MGSSVFFLVDPMFAERLELPGVPQEAHHAGVQGKRKFSILPAAATLSYSGATEKSQLQTPIAKLWPHFARRLQFFNMPLLTPCRSYTRYVGIKPALTNLEALNTRQHSSEVLSLIFS